jgi:hypothetical protein
MQDVISVPLSSASSRSSTDHADLPFKATFPFATLDNLVHELRQPLSAIEHLAFYLQLVSSDPTVCAHSERIQDLIEQTNRILERAAGADSDCCKDL